MQSDADDTISYYANDPRVVELVGKLCEAFQGAGLPPFAMVDAARMLIVFAAAVEEWQDAGCPRGGGDLPQPNALTVRTQLGRVVELLRTDHQM